MFVFGSVSAGAFMASSKADCFLGILGWFSLGRWMLRGWFEEELRALLAYDLIFLTIERERGSRKAYVKVSLAI